MSDRIRQQIELLRTEIEDVDLQLADGELDRDTAAQIKTRYETELAELEATAAATRQLDPDETPSDESGSGIRRFNGRAIAGIGLVVVAMTVIGYFAVQSLNTQQVVGADGIVGDVLRGEGQVDLADVSNEEMEEVVAANPDIVPMRLALARRYFEGGEFDKALQHYFEVLDREQHPEALANIGWMTYLSNRPDIAVGYVEAALDRQPDYLAAEWFLGNIYVALGRNDEAVVYLTKVTNSSDVPDDIKASAVTLLDQARAGG